MIIQNLFDTKLWHDLREINVLKNVNKSFLAKKWEKWAKNLLILFNFSNLGNGITLK